jgi:hypothetical protein
MQNPGVFSTLARFAPATDQIGATVRQLTLEQLFQESGVEQCDLLKIDCEGAEYDILLTARPPVLQKVQMIICEYHPTASGDRSTLIEHLSNLGFNVTADRSPVGFIMATREL